MTIIQRLAMLSVHTCPQAALGGKKTGGMNVYVRELARELGRRGIKVDVFTRYQESCQGHVHIPLGENVRVVHIRAGGDQSLDPDQLYPLLPSFASEVLAFTSAEGIIYDAIYSHYWLSGVVAHTLRAQWRIPVVQMFHTLGLMKDRIAPGEVGHVVDRPADLRSFSEADIMSWADRIIAATPAERTQMLWLYRAPRRKIEILPPGVNLARFHPMPQAEARAAIGIKEPCRLFLFVGRIEPLKGVDTIFEAIALLRQTAPDLSRSLCLSIIGGAPDVSGENAEMDRLKGLRQSLGLEDVVVFLGAKDQDALHHYYAASEALIIPSDYESFGMVALESMACGTPVIASNVGGLSFLVRDGVNGYHVPVRDPVALRDRIQLLLQHPELRAILSENAALDAVGYSWNQIGDRLVEIITRVTIPTPVGYN